MLNISATLLSSALLSVSSFGLNLVSEAELESQAFQFAAGDCTDENAVCSLYSKDDYQGEKTNICDLHHGVAWEMLNKQTGEDHSMINSYKCFNDDFTYAFCSQKPGDINANSRAYMFCATTQGKSENKMTNPYSEATWFQVIDAPQVSVMPVAPGKDATEFMKPMITYSRTNCHGMSFAFSQSNSHFKGLDQHTAQMYGITTASMPVGFHAVMYQGRDFDGNQYIVSDHSPVVSSDTGENPHVCQEIISASMRNIASFHYCKNCYDSDDNELFGYEHCACPGSGQDKPEYCHMHPQSAVCGGPIPSGPRGPCDCNSEEPQCEDFCVHHSTHPNCVGCIPCDGDCCDIAEDFCKDPDNFWSECCGCSAVTLALPETPPAQKDCCSGLEPLDSEVCIDIVCSELNFPDEPFCPDPQGPVDCPAFE